MAIESNVALGEVAEITAADGSRAIIARHGAHVVSWCTADGRERLFLSDRATIDGGAAIRGGIPVCFPQFAGQGPLPKHGYARTATWSHLGTSTFGLEIEPDSWPGWPHRCSLTIEVLLGPSTLTVVQRVEHRGDQALEFTGALHTYLACADATAVAVHGLDGRTIQGGGRVDGAIRFTDPAVDVDLAVLDVSGPVRVEGLGGPADPAMICAQTGFRDVVVWNVGSTLGAAMADLGAGQSRRYVCVEAAVAGAPVLVEPGSSWTGSQTLTVG